MSHALYEQLFEKTTAGIAVHEPGGSGFETVNQAYADALGYEQSELAAQSLLALAEEESALAGAIDRTLGGDAEQIEVRLTAGDGARRRVTLDLDTVVVDGENRLLSTVRSVAERGTEHTPTPSERRLEVALAGTNTGVWEWDVETGRVVWTESMERLFGLEPGAFEGTFEAFADYVHPEDLPTVEAAIESTVDSGERFQTEYRIERADGEQRWVYARGELHEAADGPGRIVGVVTDITERKDREQKLHEQDQLYRQLVERLPQAHYTIDEDWRITFCNETVADRLGRPVEEIQGSLVWDLLPGAEGSVLERRLRRVMETGEPERFEYKYPTTTDWVSIQAYPYADGIAAVSTDISDQREALASILDAAPVVLYRFDSEGVFREARGEMLSRLGLEPDDLIGKSIFEVYADHEAVLAAAERALEGESFRYTVTIGDITLETNYTPVYTDGEVSGVIGVSVDVTELQRQRERMEFFNSILRHDVLNGMTVIKMRAELLVDQLDGEQQQYAQTILDWCDTTTEVTKRVRRVIETLATPDEEHRLEPVDASAILERRLGELRTAYPAVSFEATMPESVRVQADELLADVLGNLLTNSIEHNDTAGLRIETAVETDGETVRIRIADNGQGVADDRKQSVFRRGETSHAKETGSGFGLFFVDVMVEKYGGAVRVEDSTDGGACFVIELQAAGQRQEV